MVVPSGDQTGPYWRTRGSAAVSQRTTPVPSSHIARRAVSYATSTDTTRALPSRRMDQLVRSVEQSAQSDGRIPSRVGAAPVSEVAVRTFCSTRRTVAPLGGQDA